MNLDASHDPAMQSWVDSANQPQTDFPIQNLPFGRFRGPDGTLRAAVAIGDQLLDLKQAAACPGWPAGLEGALEALAAGNMNRFMAMGKAARQGLRMALSEGLKAGSQQQASWSACLLPQQAVQMALPCEIGDYTDFYAGIHHATAVGRLFRPDAPLLPNYKWVPIGYHGRSSSIIVSGQPIRRPLGQTKGSGETPVVGPSQRLDYELELGFLIGTGNQLGEAITIDDAEDHLFGVTLFNDWSARDIQAWEYQPLGPFLAKNFASSLSPWVVTMEALAPFRSPFLRPVDDPQPLPYLDSAANRASGAIDITLELWLQSSTMLAAGTPPVRLSQSNFNQAYWTLAQLLTHHASNGCNLQTGDLLGTGTQSGPDAGQGGSLLELSAGGKSPIALPDGEQRTFLADGDTLILRGYCERPGAARIGFGDCAGTVLPARR